MITAASAGLASLGTWVAFSSRSVLASVVLVGSAAVLYRVARERIDVLENWVKGARSESAVGDELDLLKRDGFVVMHDVVRRGEGNIDHIVSGPSGVFLVETKHRRYELPQLTKARRQAAKLHDELGVWVTPVLCLATRDHPPAKRSGVWIMGKSHLLDWLRAQRNKPVEFETLARFADRI